MSSRLVSPYRANGSATTTCGAQLSIATESAMREKSISRASTALASTSTTTGTNTEDSGKMTTSRARDSSGPARGQATRDTGTETNSCKGSHLR